MPDPAHIPPSPDSDLTAPEALSAALARYQRYEQLLNKIMVVMAITLALVISVMAANQNFYSLLATFAAGCIFLMLAGIYQRSLLLLLPLLAVFCLSDNLLSHNWQFNLPHFALQFIALGSFTTLFRLSRPYVLNLMQKFLTL